jgi:pimeloyl-ACP methyl ester carboxylesterase
LREGAIALAGGRALAFCEWGDAGGSPVVLFHGSPGSRLFCPDDDATRDAGVRLVTFDRPGYGLSAPRTDRRLLDTADDVAALLDHLAIDRCAVIGWSGGGPFAVATAYALAERVTHLSVVSAPGPLDEVPDAWERLGEYRRPTAEMARREPARSVRAIARHMGPFLEDPVSFLGRNDPVLRGAAYPMLVAQVTEATRQGAGGIAADLVAMWCNWGFALADVDTPARVFHGALDPNNGSDARCYGANMPNASLTVWDDTGHLGVIVHWSGLLAAAVATAGGG